jgi:hypothetical protein
VAGLTRKDVNYLFHHEIIFSSADFETLNRDYEIPFGAGKLIKTGLGLLWGVLTGQFLFDSLKKFLSVSSKAGKLKAHYLKYPETPEGLAEWEGEAKKLWKEVNYNHGHIQL